MCKLIRAANEKELETLKASLANNEENEGETEVRAGHVFLILIFASRRTLLAPSLSLTSFAYK
jgi:hypothetical protein